MGSYPKGSKTDFGNRLQATSLQNIGDQDLSQSSQSFLAEVDGQPVGSAEYFGYHRGRIQATLEKLRQTGARRVIELGSHPWAMTAALVEDPDFRVKAVVSAEEVVKWPDQIEVQCRTRHLRTPGGREARFAAYEANLERTRFDLEVGAEAVLACEIIEHLLRSPHIMLLNANSWLREGGWLLITTPNGAQFSNPFRRKTQTPGYRSNIYQRHSYLYTLDQLVELVELCGFAVTESDFWNPYPANGRSRIYGLLSRMPHRYFQEKFGRTLFLLGRKVRDVESLERCPSIYDPRGEWEYVDSSS